METLLPWQIVNSKRRKVFRALWIALFTHITLFTYIEWQTLSKPLAQPDENAWYSKLNIHGKKRELVVRRM